MDVGVIGGSLAGLEFAQNLRMRTESEVTVYEAREIGEPVKCAEGWLDLYRAGTLFPEARGNPVREVLVEMRGVDGEHGRTSLRAGGAYVVDRASNERALAERCRELGADIATGRNVTVDWVTRRHDLCVDASGCPPQYWKEFDRSQMVWGKGLEFVLEADLDRYAEILYVEFAPELDTGYYWIFPRSDERANVGLGWMKDLPLEDPWRLLEDFAEDRIGEYDVKLRTAGMLGTEVYSPLYRPERDVALVGDAAGLVEPFTGEGMSQASLSGKMLAESVAFGDLDGYEDRVMAEVGPRLDFFASLADLRPRLEFEDLAKIIGLFDGWELRDFMADPGKVKKTFAKNPGLILKAGLRSLFP